MLLSAKLIKLHTKAHRFVGISLFLIDAKFIYFGAVCCIVNDLLVLMLFTLISFAVTQTLSLALALARLLLLIPFANACSYLFPFVNNDIFMQSKSKQIWIVLLRIFTAYRHCMNFEFYLVSISSCPKLYWKFNSEKASKTIPSTYRQLFGLIS